MTAVVVAMLVIVMVATAVLAAVGAYYHLASSAMVRRRLRRWRFLAVARLDDWRAASFHALRVARRGIARRLTRPAPSSSAAESADAPEAEPASAPAALPRIGGASGVTHRAA
ncbi:hypothetical protein [Jiangella sp. DSM 45060]|uniref:hypothetical protein n=1 Tax=Jiangella sp. DSM 45060 TaxID=1798224 RepID=UPI000879D125|nr:hypothetical protein [Jiangella sp. DSM 45060]SDS64107.1 hypothetical protein SAMN04515669_1562 [Jiangella sp. DSM 45060]